MSCNNWEGSTNADRGDSVGRLPMTTTKESCRAVAAGPQILAMIRNWQHACRPDGSGHASGEARQAWRDIENAGYNGTEDDAVQLVQADGGA